MLHWWLSWLIQSSFQLTSLWKQCKFDVFMLRLKKGRDFMSWSKGCSISWWSENWTVASILTLFCPIPVVLTKICSLVFLHLWVILNYEQRHGFEHSVCFQILHIVVGNLKLRWKSIQIHETLEKDVDVTAFLDAYLVAKTNRSIKKSTFKPRYAYIGSKSFIQWLIMHWKADY